MTMLPQEGAPEIPSIRRGLRCSDPHRETSASPPAFTRSPTTHQSLPKGCSPLGTTAQGASPKFLLSPETAAPADHDGKLFLFVPLLPDHQLLPATPVLHCQSLFKPAKFSQEHRASATWILFHSTIHQLPLGQRNSESAGHCFRQQKRKRKEGNYENVMWL